MLYCRRCQADDMWMEAVADFRATDKSEPIPLCPEHLNEAKAHQFAQAQQRSDRLRKSDQQLKLF